MIDTLHLYEELSQVIEPRAAQKLASVLGAVCNELQNTVTKTEFAELRDVVRELAQAQKRTEARVEELAEAQRRTEQQVQQLAQAQKRTEQRVEELAQAQKRTEERLDALTSRVEELAEAQRYTEQALARLTERVDRLAERLDDTNRQLGGLAATVGYTLENEAYRALPPLLEREHGLQLTEPLCRTYLRDREGRDLEVNIVGRARRGGEDLWIIGESKVQLSKHDVDRFVTRRVEALAPVCGKVFPLIVTHMISQRDVLDYARERGVSVYLSYQFAR